MDLFIMAVSLMAVCIFCAFGGMWIGAYIHHRGVMVGSGNRESFTGVVSPGEVFTIPNAENLPGEPGLSVVRGRDES